MACNLRRRRRSPAPCHRPARVPYFVFPRLSTGRLGRPRIRNDSPCKSGRPSICGAASASGCGRATISRKPSSPRIRRPSPGSLPTQGAKHLHIVDLEGAREGLPVNLPSVQDDSGGGRHRVRAGRRHSRRAIGSRAAGLRPVAAGDRHLGADRPRMVSRGMCRQVSRAGWCWGSTPATAGPPPTAGSTPAT